MKRISLFTLVLVLVSFLSVGASNKIQVLILSGKNNHDWKKTTQKLKLIYESSDLFEIEISNNPENLNPADLANFDVIVSNWNSFPDKEVRWSPELEKALLSFVEKGGGFVTFHASTTCFYEWAEFENISTGAWVKETKHGKQSATKVNILNKKHPVTKGMQNFVIYDELWIDAKRNASFETLGSATNKKLEAEVVESQPAIMVKEYGKGRVFHTILGHEETNMQNIGFQTLMLRGTEWAATGKVKQDLPQALRESKGGKYKWAESDTTYALMNGKDVVWRYNFREKHQKPHFNPVFVGRNNITCVAPDDHPWHAGQWFSWKYINEVNYWEFVNRKEFRSEGTTDIRNIKFARNNDFSAEIELEIVYHPANGEDILAETRTIKVSAPRPDGTVSMDYQFAFNALAEKVELNRTPLEGEENGKVWGGYGGLSLRFNQSFMDSYFITDSDNDELHGSTGNWLFMGFTGFDGNKIGSQIIIHPNSKRKEAAWYVTNKNDLPFYYYGPAHLFNKSQVLLKGEKLVLNYRINHVAGETNKAALEQKYQDYKNNKNNKS